MSIDSYLDSDRPSLDLSALESGNSLLLLILVTNLDETVALALTRTTILPADNTSRNDVDTSFGEQLSERGVIDVETQVGNKEHRLGWLALGFIASSATGTERAPFACRLRIASFRNFLGRGSGLGFAIGNCHGDLGLPLIEWGMNVNRDESIETDRGLFLLLLGFGRFTFGWRSVLWLGFAIGLGFGNLSSDGLGASPSRAPAGRFPILSLPFFLIGWLRYLDDDLAVVKLFLIKELDGFLSSFCCGEGDEPIARGPISAQNDLSGDAVDETK